VLLLVLVAVAGLYIQQGLALLSVRSQEHRQQANVARLQHENTQLTAQQRSLQDPAVIQQDARALGMIRVGERPYVVTGLH
jgi:cell division protein FtsB